MPKVAAVKAHPSMSQKSIQKSAKSKKCFIQELKASLAENRVEVTKALFANAVQNEKKPDCTIESLFNTLKENGKDKKALRQLKSLICINALKEAVLNNDPSKLTSPLATESGIQQLSINIVIKALEEIGNMKAKRLASEIDEISKISFARHKLDPVDMLAVCLAAEAQLEKLADTVDAIYMRPDELGVKRACVLDPRNHSFTILSKSNGMLNAQGAFKRVSDAIQVTLHKDKAKARSIAHVRNKADEYIPKYELEYEHRYGKVITWLRYKSKNRPDETKTLMLQEVYDHDLYVFTEFTDEEYRKKISFEDLLVVFEKAGRTLLKMHKDGVVHRDVKAKNILYRKSKDGKVSGRLIDFGHAYEPDSTTQFRKRNKGYGTLRYTAPDLLEKPNMKGDPLFLAKAEDAYALGECIYEVYLQLANPWGSIAYRALKKKDKEKADEQRKEAVRLQKEEAALLAREAKSHPHTLEKELFGIMAKLLEPNPKKRMTIPEFMEALYDLKGKHAKMKREEIKMRS